MIQVIENFSKPIVATFLLNSLLYSLSVAIDILQDMESGESEEPEGLGLKPYQDNFCGACGVLVSDEEYLEDDTPHLESQQIGHPYIELVS